MRESNLEKVGVKSYIKNNEDWILKQKRNINQFQQVQSKIYKAELTKNTVLRAMINVVTEVMPKTVKTLILKLKIQMQTLIGNAFGLKFPTLQYNKEKLERMQSSE